MSQFNDRLKIIIKDESVNAFAKKCGITEGTLRTYLSGSSLPGLDKLVSISDAAQVNIEWLATGKGPMEKGDHLYINPELLSLVLESIENYEKATNDKFLPIEKASKISILYDLFFDTDEDITTEEGKKSVFEVISMFLVMSKAMNSVIESEKGREYVIRSLQEVYEKTLSKEDVELKKRSTLKGIDAMIKILAQQKTKK